MSLASFTTEWDQLATRCSTPPFLRAAFFVATERWLPPRGTAHCACARRADELLAILPLVRRGGRICALESVHTPRFDMTGTPEGAEALWRALRDDPSWYVLELRSVPRDSLLVTVLAEHARADGFRIEMRPRSTAPFFELGNFERALDGDFRRKLLARRRKLADLTFERASPTDATAITDLFRLEAAAWKGTAGTAIASNPHTVAFYRELAASFASHLSINFLRANGRRISAHFALEDDRTYYLLKPGYDPELARFGPGHLHIYEAALDARRRGRRELDLLGQSMEWKRPWTTGTRQHISLEIFRPCTRGTALHAARYRIRPVLGAVRRVACSLGEGLGREDPRRG